MLISFFKRDAGNLPFEGLNTVNNKIYNYLRKRGFSITLNNSKINFIHAHISGFLPLLKLFFSKKEHIISLYSNPKISTIPLLRNYLEQYFLFSKNYSFKRKYYFFRRILLSTLSSCIPLFVKKELLKKAKYVIVPSKNLKKVLKIKNIQVIPIGVDTNLFKKIKTVKKDIIKVSYFGHAGVNKGFTDLVKAFKILKDKGINKNFFFSNYSGELRSLRKKGNIKIHGFVKNIVKKYNESDIIVLPYRTANSAIDTPLVLLETMACEKAIITTNLPNIREIVDDSAIIVDPYSPKQIAKAVILLSKDIKLRKKLGKKARKRIVQKYNLKIMLNEYEKIYLKLNT